MKEDEAVIVQKILDGSHGFSKTFNKKLHLDISKREQNNLFIKINNPTGQAYSNLNIHEPLRSKSILNTLLTTNCRFFDSRRLKRATDESNNQDFVLELRNGSKSDTDKCIHGGENVQSNEKTCIVQNTTITGDESKTTHIVENSHNGSDTEHNCTQVNQNGCTGDTKMQTNTIERNESTCTSNEKRVCKYTQDDENACISDENVESNYTRGDENMCIKDDENTCSTEDKCEHNSVQDTASTSNDNEKQENSDIRDDENTSTDDEKPDSKYDENASIQDGESNDVQTIASNSILNNENIRVHDNTSVTSNDSDGSSINEDISMESEENIFRNDDAQSVTEDVVITSIEEPSLGEQDLNKGHSKPFVRTKTSSKRGTLLSILFNLTYYII
jgi:hypothetical protein